MLANVNVGMTSIRNKPSLAHSTAKRRQAKKSWRTVRLNVGKELRKVVFKKKFG